VPECVASSVGTLVDLLPWDEAAKEAFPKLCAESLAWTLVRAQWLQRWGAPGVATIVDGTSQGGTTAVAELEGFALASAIRNVVDPAYGSGTGGPNSNRDGAEAVAQAMRRVLDVGRDPIVVTAPGPGARAAAVLADTFRDGFDFRPFVVQRAPAAAHGAPIPADAAHMSQRLTSGIAAAWLSGSSLARGPPVVSALQLAADDAAYAVTQTRIGDLVANAAAVAAAASSDDDRRAKKLRGSRGFSVRHDHAAVTPCDGTAYFSSG
jgi:hypothetical protein